ncbi:MAG: serine/threonine-protein kinase [Acidobacteria bacterium]|nr:serine/threonine-protein kinase [Acidobacteriota bacterium]
MVGQTLSHYRVTAALGAGGMGEVYRATDTNLGREVAIKVLPSEVAEDPERLGRFKREAQLLAALNHPNIAAIYGLEETDGTPFLALELVEGEDLKERLERGAVPVDEALEIAKQIAAGLEEAHEKGIVHRDLKPANVKLTPDGRVKVLDFGLARAFSGDAGSGSTPDLSQSPTLAHSGTQAGLILGTAAYMSPEQARGARVDKRADIWAFGVVLLEMLTGRNAFSDSTVSDTLASVLKSAPDLASLPPEVPPRVQRVLERCLRKDRKERFRDIGDVLLELSGSAEEPETVPSRNAVISRRTVAGWLVAGIALGAAGFGLLSWKQGWLPTRRPPSRTIRLEAAPPADTHLERGLALSPDGSKIALVASDAQGQTAVWIRALDALEARRLSGTEGGRLPFWSPDGRSLAFFTSGHLLAVDLVGGAPRSIAETDQDAVDARGGAWSPDGTIVFAPAFTGPLVRVAADGSGPPEPATTLEAGQGTHRFPSLLPDGRHFLFYASAGSGIEPGELRLGELGSLETRKLVEASSAAVYLPTGHLVFARGETMLARPFDASRLVFAGEPVSIGIEIPTGSSISGLRSISASADGTLVYRADPSSATDLVWVDREGHGLGTLGEPGSWKVAPRISPDGRRVVVGAYGAGSVNAGNLWIFDASRDVGRPLTFDASDDANAIWSPDGRQVAFGRAKSQDTFGLYVLTVDAPQDVKELVAPETGWLGPDCWTPDRAQVFFNRRGTATGSDILIVGVEDGAEPREWLATPFNEAGADVSPDGHWVAYASDVGGSYNVYVKPLEGPGTPWQVSTKGGTSPRWSPRGGELFFRSQGNQMMAAPVSISDGRFSTGAPIPLFAAGIGDEQRDYDVTPDGQRFLLARPADTAGAPLVVVLGFDQTLKDASSRP